MGSSGGSTDVDSRFHVQYNGNTVETMVDTSAYYVIDCRPTREISLRMPRIPESAITRLFSGTAFVENHLRDH